MGPDGVAICGLWETTESIREMIAVLCVVCMNEYVHWYTQVHT